MRRIRLVLPLATVMSAAALSVLYAQAPPPPVAEPARVAAAAEPLAPHVAAALELDKKLITEAKERSELLANLTYLSDVIGPRLTGSANLERANRWTAEKMKSYGLENVRLEPWTIPMGWERGTATLKLQDPENGKSLTVAAGGWSPSTQGPIAGDVVIVRVSKKEDLEQYKGKLKNAIVLESPPATVRPINDLLTARPDGAPGGRGGAPGRDRAPDAQAKGPPADAKGGAPPAGGFGRGGFGQNSELAREIAQFLRAEGAVVTLRDAGKPHGLLTMSGRWQSAERAGATDPLPTLYTAHEHYALLWRLASRPAPAKTRAVVEVNNKLIPGPITVYNTVGEVRGSEKPDEFVVVGAHIDSWDLAQGTTDNGTGTCVVLEAARLLAKSGVKPRRTIRFCLFSGEEQGLHGSRAYTNAHKDEMPKTSLALVHDTGTGKVLTIGTAGRAGIKPIFERELLPSLKPLGVTEINTRSGVGGGSDHASFNQSGVPGVMLSQDMMTFYRLTHHSQSDALELAREADLVQGAQVMAIAALRVANLPELLPREGAPPERRRP